MTFLNLLPIVEELPLVPAAFRPLPLPPPRLNDDEDEAEKETARRGDGAAC